MHKLRPLLVPTSPLASHTPLISEEHRGINFLEMNESLARNPIWFPAPPPPDLIRVDSSLCRILARVEAVQSVVGERPRAIEGEPTCPDNSGWHTMGGIEANGLGLVGNNVGLLTAVRGAVDGAEGQFIPEAGGGAGTADDEWLGVELVLDLAELGTVVGVVYVKALEVVNIQVAPRDGETEIDGRSFLDGGSCLD